MKFAKELEQELVPEWRAKYFNYKLGKKKIKAVARALRNLNQTPRTPDRRRPEHLFLSPGDQDRSRRSPFTSYPILNRRKTIDATETANDSNRDALLQAQLRTATGSDGARRPQTLLMNTPPLNLPETQPLKIPSAEEPSNGGLTRYGSIIGTPPKTPPSEPHTSTLKRELTTLELPDPVLDPEDDHVSHNHKPWDTAPSSKAKPRKTGDAYSVGETRHPHSLSDRLIPPHRTRGQPSRTKSTPGRPDADPRKRHLFKRMVSGLTADSPGSSTDFPMEAYRELDARQEEFFNFLDEELEKIEAFYKMKENEANERLQVLRDQLHEMRDRRMEEVLATQRAKPKSKSDEDGSTPSSPLQTSNGAPVDGDSKGINWKYPLERAKVLVGNKHRFGRDTKAMGQLGTPREPNAVEGADIAGRRDFVRRPEAHDKVPYRMAKRRLKVALQEYYRGLELLKSYALLNRTAFRKINKKYDKAVNARPTGRYMSEKVNKAWFVQSEVVEGHIVAVEDLYARYFERGNHKVAVGKLRSKGLKSGDFSPNAFRNGVLLASGFVLALQGVVYASGHLDDPDPSVRASTSFLLQVYGGYFLATFHFLLFCLDCRIWSNAKINYTFVFEYDTRHVLDWRQLSELPCLFFFGLGLFLWLNFRIPASNPMFHYWPIVLIVLTVLIMFFPAPVLYHRARAWWAYSNWRLLLAGLYPVEFRDFFLGDMYCSQTYTMGSLEIFFCLYSRDWSRPELCNSSHSRLLGFLSTLPGIWRLSQCLRRYYDTRNIFPHLVNCGKYTFTVLFYMSLSMYRIDRSHTNRAAFITLATVNGIYVTVWDLAMDWSLGNPYAKYPFLRDMLGFKRAWYYYLAMIVDPILRFNWVFYAIFANDVQHSAILAFMVGFSEVLRRGMWSLFRVENEHCTNVGRFRASRDIPLPYDLPSSSQVSLDHAGSPRASKEDERPPRPEGPEARTSPGAARSRATGTDIEAAAGMEPVSPSSPVRLRRTRSRPTPQTPVQRGIVRVGTLMAAAHSQDFERRRRTSVVGAGASPSFGGGGGSRADNSSDDDGDDDDDDIADEMNEMGRMIQTMRSDEVDLAGAERVTADARGGDRSAAAAAAAAALETSRNGNGKGKGS